MSTDFANRRKRCDTLLSQLKLDRTSFESHWQELARFMKPRRTRFTTSDVNRGDRRTQEIIDSTGTIALRTLQAGLMSGMTSPARPWFRLTTPDTTLSESAAVKDWLHTVTKEMRSIFLRSNLYQALPVLYNDMGLFATGAMSVMEDDEKVIRCETFPIGSYYCANDAYGRVRVFAREYRMTVRQLIEEFGGPGAKAGKPDLSKFSTSVRNQYERGNYEKWFDVVHIVMPNDQYNPNRIESRFKRFVSLTYEKGKRSEAGEGQYLRESGFDEFPVLVGRWEVTGEDTYGTDCPGMTALGDIKQLQLGERRSAQAIDKMVNPPMVGPTALQNVPTPTIPGGLTFDDSEAKNGFRPAYLVDPRTQELEYKQEQIRFRIRRAFFEDLFLMLQQAPKKAMTATEVDERREEKFLVLGPVMGRTDQDVLDPLIDRTFAIMLRAGRIPPPPQELQGATLQVEYTSVMAQALKLATVGNLDRFASISSQIIDVSPESVDKIDFDQLIDEYGDATDVPPRIIRSDDVVAEIRAQRARAAQQQQMAAMLKDASVGVKNLSQADTSGPNALTNLFGGAQAA